MTLEHFSEQDCAELFAALDDPTAWEHIPQAIPHDAAELGGALRRKLADGLRLTFIIRCDGRVAGMTSVLFDPADPDGCEVGGTQLGPAWWGTGVNTQCKRLLFDALFVRGAQWIQLRTDERNGRSAAAIAKLGTRDLGTHPDTRVRRDGTRRRSRIFRVDPPPEPVVSDL